MDQARDPIREIDFAIRDGEMAQARRALESLPSAAGLPPAKLANLWWRLGEPGRGQRLLARAFTEVNAQVFATQPEEAAEYAACLLRLGAFAEAEWILKLPEVAAMPMASLYEGFAYLEIWDYPKAIPCFKRFVGQSGLADYWQRVGYVNLAAALIYEHRHDEAGPILRRLLHDSQLGKNKFMLGYVLETAAADRVLRRDFADARKFLTEAEQRWSSVGGLDHFFLEKWRVLAEVAEDATKKPKLEPLKRKAIELGHWETVRDCDRYCAIWTHDRELFLKLHFGTPFPAFRERLKKDFGAVEIPERFAFPTEQGPGDEFRILIDDKARARSKISSQSYALLAMLASDFYRAHRLVTLFAWLFPDQHFQPQQVAKRMHEALRRLNAWLKRRKEPMRVLERDSEYTLAAIRPVTLWVPTPQDVLHSWQPIIVRIFRKFGREPFATREAEEFLNLPRRTLVRQLQSLVVVGHLEQLGQASATRYRVSPTWQS